MITPKEKADWLTDQQFVALIESAEHWLENWWAIYEEKYESYSITSRTCSCCRNFSGAWCCIGCPIYERTCETACGDTPYDEVFEKCELNSGTKEAALKAAKKEYLFLLDLAFGDI